MEDTEKNINFSKIKNIKFLYDLPKTSDSYTPSSLDNTFTVFNSIDNILFLIYSNRKCSIIFYNLINNKKMTEIKNAHNSFITNIRHYLDTVNNRDLLLSTSSYSGNVKLWDIQNMNILLNIQHFIINSFLNSSCILNDDNKNYIIISNLEFDKYDYDPDDIYLNFIRIYDMKGNFVNSLLNRSSFFVDTYFDKINNKNYIISANKGNVISYDFKNNSMFKCYSEGTNIKNNKAYNNYFSVIIREEEDKVKLIASSGWGNIVIWDFYSGLFLKKIYLGNYRLYGICSWNENYLLIGSKIRSVKIFDYQEEKIIFHLSGFYSEVLTIKKFIHPKYGECFITQERYNCPLKLFLNK